MPHMLERLNNPLGLSSAILQLLATYTGREAVPDAPAIPEAVAASRRISQCKESGKMSRLANSTKNKCDKCGKPVCGKHSQPIGFVCMASL